MKPIYLLAAGVALIGCADGASSSGPSSVGEAEQKTLRLELEPDHVVEYAVGARGEVLIEEIGRQGVHELAANETNLARPSAVFARYHPGAAVPSEVKDFEKLLGKSQVDALPEEDVEPSDAPEDSEDAPDVQKHATNDAAHFRDGHHGCFFGPSDVATSCLTSRTGGGSSSASARWAIYKTAAYRGSITVRRTYGSGSAVRVIDQGIFNWSWARGGLTQDCNLFGCSTAMEYPAVVSHRVEVYNADGDGYHRSARFHNLKYPTPECAEVSTANPPADSLVACLPRY